MVEIRTARPADAPATGEMLGEAFRDDPAWAQFYPDATSRSARLTAHYRRHVSRHPDRVDVAVDGAEVLGALLWEPPHRDAGRFSGWVGRIAAALRYMVSPTARRGRAHTRAVEAHRPSEPHWYFHDIAAGPRARGKGIGSALLRHRLDLIDRGGPYPVFLEATTSGSRRLYERFGFRPVGTVPTGPGQESTTMIRPAGGGEA
ncbi:MULTISPECIES: GNAT family N-acetyltransferase [unclassified Dietzia]|uniref:GNAT family N-acetyltransferase n=1 Tax=unclassified Dietzia TaxID=2617939 RepID=UPI000D22ACC0|nr:MULTISPECIES: GNAT family N-acetyltransferase [unclassified Dietzia]AVZ40774.1 GNAT family N-acetyltransferase [Dietzia sp. JS16-p6b]MBB1025764.1 GNAT family N-acetyltransferase [Dietzia sp. DQ12-76]MBB1026449.1 GNAT family N-acetyltransferase [Dietzia sp. DQ11-38-2]QGW26372.1 GNAT acetyltransferase [Dietzia sp. DQ12-45-1b]